MNIQYVELDCANPFRNINKDTISSNTIIIPDLSNYAQSDTLALNDWLFSDYFDNLFLNFIFYAQWDYCFLHYDNIEEYFLRINLSNLKFIISNNTVNQIKSCIKNKKIIILPIRLDLLEIQLDYNISYPDHQEEKSIHNAHSNLLIIDSQNEIIEFFEPHGIILQHTYSNIINLQESIENFLKYTFDIDYTFVNIANICPIGLQAYQSYINPNAGHCLVWSAYLITVRLMNAHYKEISYDKTTSQTLNEILINHFSNNADQIIRQFFSYIESCINITSRPYSSTRDSTYNLLNYIQDTRTIEDRLRHLIRTYFVNAFFYHRDFKIIFREITSYKNLPNFDTIFVEEMSKSYDLLYHNQPQTIIEPIEPQTTTEPKTTIEPINNYKNLDKEWFKIRESQSQSDTM
jgi:hypothetical protein